MEPQINKLTDPVQPGDLETATLSFGAILTAIRGSNLRQRATITTEPYSGPAWPAAGTVPAFAIADTALEG